MAPPRHGLSGRTAHWPNSSVARERSENTARCPPRPVVHWSARGEAGEPRPTPQLITLASQAYQSPASPTRASAPATAFRTAGAEAGAPWQASSGAARRVEARAAFPRSAGAGWRGGSAGQPLVGDYRGIPGAGEKVGEGLLVRVDAGGGLGWYADLGCAPATVHAVSDETSHPEADQQ